MRSRLLPLILIAITLLIGCQKHQDVLTSSPVPAAPSATEAIEQPSASSLTPTRPADDIDARLTHIAETVHPQLTDTAVVMQPDLALTAGLLTPIPTSTFAPSVPQVIYEAPEIRWGFWSPDSRWISFYVPPPEVEGFTVGAVPVFYEVATGRTCMYEEFGGTMQYEYPTTYSYWQPDGYATLLVDGVPYAGLPCEEFVRAPDSFGPGPADTASALSPDGTVRIETTYDIDVYPPPAVTTFTDVATGQVLNRVEWYSVSGQVQGWIGGQWLGSSMFLMNATYDRGPLLIHMGEEDFIEVAPELFDFELRNVEESRLGAYGAFDEHTGDYHILLGRPDVNGNLVEQLLYHSEGRDIESLPFEYAYFTPDGNWLKLQNSTEELTLLGTAGTWFRAVDGRKQAPAFAGRVDYPTWPDPANMIAYLQADANFSTGDVIIATFPEMQVLSRWHVDGRMLTPWGWSPDGTKLLISSPYNGNEPARLYVVEP